MNRWQIPDNVAVTSFDWTWQPPEYDPPFIYQFGTQWQKTHGPRYIVDDAEQVKYIDTPRARSKPRSENFYTLNPDLEISEFDFSWHPDATEPDYCHVFSGNLGNDHDSVRIFSGDQKLPRKYHDSPTAKLRLRPLSVFFMSNGEHGSESRYQVLSELCPRPVTWVRDIQGRENAIRSCAEQSETQYFMCWPGKLRAEPGFDFAWQPDPRHDAKHYIFQARNPVNNLIYGHQAMVVYNRRLVLDTIDYGLDFTMSRAHDVVDIISGTAEYNLEPFMCWRTAFREAVKLRHQNDAESLARLEIWLAQATGENSEYSRQGAAAGVKFYTEVNGDPVKLQQSFHWSWLEAEYRKVGYKS
jgi:hypothetical protein